MEWQGSGSTVAETETLIDESPDTLQAAAARDHSAERDEAKRLGWTGSKHFRRADDVPGVAL